MVSTPLANETAKRVVYKAYTDPTISPGAGPLPATAPGATGGQIIRRASSVANLQIAEFTSEELNTFQQVADVRTGARKVTGTISGELSPKNWQDLMAAVMRGTWTAGNTKNQTAITSLAATAASSKFTLGASDWATQGFRIGDVFRPTITGANNGLNFALTGIATADGTVYPSPVDMTAQITATVTVPGRKLTMPDVPVKTKFAIEHYYADSNIAHLFTECRFGSMKVSMTEKVSMVEFGFIGRDKVLYDAGVSSPFFTAPTAPPTFEVLTTFGGFLLLNGTPVAAITKAEFTLNLKPSSQDPAFSKYVPEIYLGKANLTGSIDVLFVDNSIENHFSNEDILSLAFMVTTANTSSADFISFFMPSVKLGGATFSGSGEAGVSVNFPFTAFRKSTTTGYDTGMLTIIDSLSA